MAAPTRRQRPAAARARGDAARNAEITRTTTSTFKDSKSDHETETAQEETLASFQVPAGVPLATVSVSIGGTYNLGSYESLRLDVSVTIPCAVADVDQAYAQAAEFVGDKLQEEETVWLGRKVEARRRQQ